MLDSVFAQIGAELSVKYALMMVGSALVCGIIVSIAYMLTHKKEGISPSFTVTLVMLPTIISLIVLLIGSNVARAFTLAGAFSLIRYRSTPGNPKDLTYILLTLGLGVACGIGFIGYAFLFAILLCAVLGILSAVSFGSLRGSPVNLTITIPESINYEGIFDEVLSQYTSFNKLTKIKTTDFGTMYELKYRVKLKPGVPTKEFVDRLRERNGNMNIQLSLAPTADGESW